jgi:GNAT superfamily N-acetyltransferase
MDVEIRVGTPSDIPDLLRLIQELADYEKAPNEVVVTEEILLEDGFGDNAIFEFFVAEHKSQILGIALYYTKYSTWKGRCLFLEDIIVTRSARQKGIGTLLMKAVIEQARVRKVKRLEWQVLNWNTPAIEFYKKINASIDDEWLNGRMVFT